MMNEREKAAREAAFEAAREGELRSYLRDYLGPESGDLADRLRFSSADSLRSSEHLREQVELFGPELLRGVRIVEVPADDWFKGDQPSESHAERGLVLVREGYLQEGDEAAWLTHELAHCEQHDAEPETYGDRSARKAYPEVGGEQTYPNNEVERGAFLRQFGYLKSAGVERADVEAMLAEHYGPEDDEFFVRLLDETYG